MHQKGISGTLPSPIHVTFKVMHFFLPPPLFHTIIIINMVVPNIAAKQQKTEKSQPFYGRYKYEKIHIAKKWTERKFIGLNVMMMIASSLSEWMINSSSNFIYNVSLCACNAFEYMNELTRYLPAFILSIKQNKLKCILLAFVGYCVE